MSPYKLKSCTHQQIMENEININGDEGLKFLDLRVSLSENGNKNLFNTKAVWLSIFETPLKLRKFKELRHRRFYLRKI